MTTSTFNHIMTIRLKPVMGVLGKREYLQFLFPHYKHYYICNILTQTKWLKDSNNKHTLFSDFIYPYIHISH